MLQITDRWHHENQGDTSSHRQQDETGTDRPLLRQLIGDSGKDWRRLLRHGPSRDAGETDRVRLRACPGNDP